MRSFDISCLLVDVFSQTIYPARINIRDGRIHTVEPLNESATLRPGYILPGFIDSHVHIESSMLVPAQFARIAVTHGTVGTVSDPHEIANVCGLPGIEFMIDNGKTVPFKFTFGAPSCVPATSYETAGATLDSKAVADLLGRKEIGYLSEMMNFPGVLQHDPEVMAKLNAAKKNNKPVDGHAPGLRGKSAKSYIDSGISTDHECFTEAEGKEKLEYGMKIIIREGSAARNFEALIALLHDYPDEIMFGSDDKHPDSLVQGHIGQLCARAVRAGIPLYNILKAACINPVLHYKLDIGLLRIGDPADFIIVEDLKGFKNIQTWINGILVAENGKSHISVTAAPTQTVNNFHCSEIRQGQLSVFRNEVIGDDGLLPVIGAQDGQLITKKIFVEP
ncbi:MAG TPA: amidohydrolase family protein, partial [Flavitalea sp.]|nr:amidohydrolase family protein [Flavitalea sp.]